MKMCVKNKVPQKNKKGVINIYVHLTLFFVTHVESSLEDIARVSLDVDETV